nr:four helix bundle protein [Verrucomicrobium sp. BvORR034]
MGEIKSYRDLVVWQKSMALVREIYLVSRNFPKEEQFGLTQQLRRAAVSIPSNIAEGNGRGSNSDYVRFLQYSRGSLFETQTQLELCRDLGFLSDQNHNPLAALGSEIERMLNTIISRFSS